MPRLALISDIHANLEALEATLADIARVDVDSVACLGDVVGYGPDPARCVELVMNACDVVLMGNHEEAVLSGPDARFNETARRSAHYAQAQLTPNHLKAIKAWPARSTCEGVLLAHATFGPSRYEYLYTPAAAARAFAGFSAPFGAVGHTHVPSAFSHEAGDAEPLVRAYQVSGPALVGLPQGARYILNPGSVGQPRDKNPDASCAILDTDSRTFEVRRIAYDAQAVRHKIRLAGLPERLGERLLIGA